ncbi:CAP10 domain-containing protein [Mycena indigotica]|uniref:CAP10 domain-containing protein n=1 Tax=Mycena indigotica TaxID=2126181 RepID=A0A8H6WIN8_9AGAR|nr:CAP10 domain-containing protein [Mycena indigotica]KAF7316323.1 CAP10 domain-containing protein [Mycena indigotica]
MTFGGLYPRSIRSPPSDSSARYGRSSRISKRLRCLPFTVLFGCLGLVFLSSSVPYQWKDRVADLQFAFHDTPVSTIDQGVLAAQTHSPESTSLAPPPKQSPSRPNPVYVASKRIEELYERQSKTLEEATARYSARNNRTPPDNFDKWFKLAKANSCLIDDYDQIHRDLEPWYRLAESHPKHFQKMIDLGRNLMLKDPKGMATIKIQNGQVLMPNYTGSAFDGEWPTTLSGFKHVLPDMDFMINGRDEPRVVFNTEDAELWKSATELNDSTPFRLSPIPTHDFFMNKSGCRVLHSDSDPDEAIDALEDVAFIRSASSSDFTSDLWPILSMTKITPCFADILFPGQYYYDSSAWSGKFGQPNNLTWEDKKPQLYWRGASNGGHIIHDNYRTFSRFRLVKIAESNPDLVNAKITSFWETHCTFDCERGPIIDEYGIDGHGSPREEVYHFKYLLDVDGNTFSGRYLGLLRSGSLVFKATAFAEYFSDWLRPYEHYVPVRIGLDDLVEKIEWALTHEDEARQIQENGMQFARKVLTDAQNNCYFALVLLEWARLQGYAKEAVSVAPVVSKSQSFLGSGSQSTPSPSATGAT